MSKNYLGLVLCLLVVGCSPNNEVVDNSTNGTRVNIILFLGDGMGISTVTAARILQGQIEGRAGEENYLGFERFPNVALVKTYNTDAQVPDSAGTMTAIMTGSKTRAGVIGVGPEVERGDCVGSREYTLPTLLEKLEQDGYRTGIVSTTTITHATPAATYGHSPDRNWELDTAIPEEHRLDCKDLAAQLVEFEFGDGLDLALGGGRYMFYPTDVADSEYPDQMGGRTDGRDLVQEWLSERDGRQFVTNKEAFGKLPVGEGQVLGLFEPSHMQFEADRHDGPDGEPSIAEMTEFAINHLSGKEGFFLMVEGGRIDHAHHAGNAQRALVDAIAFSEAIDKAVEMTDVNNTLILVTADHSHTLTISGYPSRGNPILGYASIGNEPLEDEDGNPYTTLGYINGPGALDLPNSDDPEDLNYRQLSAIPLRSETHAGEDVAAYALGPGALRLRGVIDQNEIYNVMLESVK